MPLGSVVVVIVGGVGAAAIVMRNARVALRLFASVTLAVKSKFPADVGVPERLPFGFRFTPPGSAPAETAHVYGASPPVAASVAENG